MSIVIKGGTIVTALDKYKADIRIDGEKIVAIGDDLERDGDEIISAKGCYILPGGVDPHTHFDLDFETYSTADDFESGTKAALAGGTTTIIDFATQDKGKTLNQGLDKWNRKSKGKTYCDYGFHMAISDWNNSVSGEIEDMVNKGITSFKIYMTYKNILQMNDGDIYKALKRSKELGVLIAFHCENGDLIDSLIDEAKSQGKKSPKYHPLTKPIEVEKEAITRLLQIAEMANAPVYIVHLSTRKGLEEVIKAKLRGAEVYVESCPQYLILDDSHYELEGFEGAKYVLSPPLRNKENLDGLWRGLKLNEIDTIGTDHCSFNFRGQKELGIDDFSKIPNGIPGVEHRISLLYTYGVKTGKIDINKLVQLTSTNPAKIFGLYPKKGNIAVGSDGDLVIWDFNKSSVITAKNQFHNVDYTPYEGYEIHGEIQHVLLRGNRVFSRGKIIGDVQKGKFIKRVKLGGVNSNV
ncbi:dihydropyrimidinase [Clostridium sp. D2Q-14]|uniref:dihydropyrimidinase n=1 Tax=Anaeromonas gelatinilytica TaxID=2683194 RepID=UPI00193B18CF|nr:dihydropyrimidinase [Anaeromonas gelatinilytica]MBS4535228.1 dihydropyrimidinase [Anaeromonas gelatinilytica]